MRPRPLALTLLLLVTVAGTLSARDRMSYIYKRGDLHYTRMSGAIDRVGAVSRKYGSEFVWVRLDGRNYLIRDAATLGEVRQAFAAVEALEPPLREIERRMKPFEREMEVIEKRVDVLGEQLDDEDLAGRTRESIERKLEDAESDMRDVERRMEAVEREMEKIEAELEKRERVAEKRFESIVERAIRSGVAQRVE